jgi:hypothetical protein
MISGFTPEGFSPLAGGRVLAHPIGTKFAQLALYKSGSPSTIVGNNPATLGEGTSDDDCNTDRSKHEVSFWSPGR